MLRTGRERERARPCRRSRGLGGPAQPAGRVSPLLLPAVPVLQVYAGPASLRASATRSCVAGSRRRPGRRASAHCHDFKFCQLSVKASESEPEGRRHGELRPARDLGHSFKFKFVTPAGARGAGPLPVAGSRAKSSDDPSLSIQSLSGRRDNHIILPALSPYIISSFIIAGRRGFWPGSLQ